jgi:CBS-domain-containing membrane protein
MKTSVKDVMTTHVIWVRKDASFQELAAALRKHRVSAFPVLGDGDKVIGIVSEADMLTKEAFDGEPGLISGLLHHRDAEKARGITAEDLMTAAVVAIAPEDTVEHAARLMYTRKVKRLPVIDANGHLVGIISRADVLSVFDRPDGEICEEINGLLRNSFLIDPQAFDVTVKGGVVTLAGVPESDEVGHDIVCRVRHVQGVVAVRDRLSYPRPERGEPHFDVLAHFPMD